MKRTLCIGIAVLHLSACTSLSTVPYGGSGSGVDSVRVGDRVVVTTASGGHQFEVVSVTAEEVCGKDECFRADRVQRVQREEVDVLRTVGAFLALAILIGLAAAHGGSFGYPGIPAAF